mgnify:FL=1|tara:strand:- start:2237 stop:2620 length:384 start_codon:yes stop_codon:yes gene_type:complete
MRENMSKKEKDILSESNIDDNDFQVLKYLDNTQITSQREISKSLNISLGKINFILKALIDKGIVKARNFKNNKNKRAYAYYLTPKGIDEKTRLTISFFDRKSKEYDKLKKELRDLEKEIKASGNKNE